MPKLTKQQLISLNQILSNMKLAESYIMKDTIVVGSKLKSAQDNPLSYIPSNKYAYENGMYEEIEAICLHTKENGSYLCQLPASIKQLQQFIESNSK